MLFCIEFETESGAGDVWLAQHTTYEVDTHADV